MINAKPHRHRRRRSGSSCCSASARRCCSSGLFILHRAARPSAGGGALGAFGRSRAKRYEASERRVTFADVAGIDEAKDELVEVVDFLETPTKYTRARRAVPKGVLLSGPPGTGKTLLARAVAGEAGRAVLLDLRARSSSRRSWASAPAACATCSTRPRRPRRRSSSSTSSTPSAARAAAARSFGGNDEREQTLNQILTEMDGFTGTEGVIVLAATNRPEVLDSALLRPGRFDRRVIVSPPDQIGRGQILAGAHARRPARARRRPRRDRLEHAGHGRRRPRRTWSTRRRCWPPAAATTP